jgi:hypothetical protein
MLHKKGKEMISDLKKLGAQFTWTESLEHAGSPELQPDSQKDHEIIMDYIDGKTEKDPHHYSLVLSPGSILVRCLKCEEIGVVNTYNSEELEATLTTISNTECAECFHEGLEILSYVSFDFIGDTDGWI